MKKILIVTLVLSFIMALSSSALADCATIQDGTLFTPDGEQITTGYSEWGYNYQAHIFNGMYCDYHPIYRPSGTQHEWCIENYGDVELIMKWNDSWLSNKDCELNGLLDRHHGYPSYIGSGAWETNHQSGWVIVDGKRRKWTYFVKIVAVPLDAVIKTIGGVDYWYTPGDIQIGEEIWGSFAIIQQVSNDPLLSEHGILYLSPAGPGFGIYGAE